ncbi:MAG: hypothetical protein LBU32_08540 [Clostridiales bacterium]|jgi:hypothetical protein|nr:hypothetical protein [Clostridiales bacterium]
MPTSIEQAYYTRAYSQKFSRQAGFGVSGASGGLDAASASLYIESIGKFVFFRTMEDWAYLILPSASGTLSVTRGVQVKTEPADEQSASARICSFLHTYIINADEARRIVSGNGAEAARFQEFRQSYVGSPEDLEILDGLPRLRQDNDPRNLTLKDVWFTQESMKKLLAAIAAIYEGGSKLRQVFVCYDCPRQDFEPLAMKLASLLYSCLPYCMANQLGCAVKTDNTWREDYPSGFETAYRNNALPAGQQWYIPGAQVYILNEPVKPIPQNGIVFRASSSGISSDVAVKINPNHQELLSLICSCMDKSGDFKSYSGLMEFFRFLFEACKGVSNFSGACSIHQMVKVLRNPEMLDAFDSAKLDIVVSLLNACAKDHFSDADPDWHEKAAIAYYKIADRARELSADQREGFCLQMLELGRFLAFELNALDHVAFIKSLHLFLEFLIRGKNEKILNELYKDELVFEALLQIDLEKKSMIFSSICLDLIGQGGADGLIEVFRHYNGYAFKLPQTDLVKAMYASVKELRKDEQSRARLGPFLKAGADASGLCKFHMDILDLGDGGLEECARFFESCASQIEFMIDACAPKETWAAKYFIYKIATDSSSRRSKWTMLQNALFPSAQSDVDLESIDAYRNFIFPGNLTLNEPTLEAVLVKYMELGAQSLTIDWSKLLDDLQSRGKSFGFIRHLFRVLEACPVNDYSKFLDLYRLLRGALLTRSDPALYGRLSELQNNYRKIGWMSLLLEGLKSTAYVNESLKDAPPSYSIFCQECCHLNPISGSSRQECFYCSCKLEESHKLAQAMLIRTNSETISELFGAEKKKSRKFIDDSQIAVSTDRRSFLNGTYTIRNVSITSLSKSARKFLSVNRRMYNTIFAVEDNGSIEAVFERFSQTEDILFILSQTPPAEPALPSFYESDRGFVFVCSKSMTPEEIIRDIALCQAFYPHEPKHSGKARRDEEASSESLIAIVGNFFSRTSSGRRKGGSEKKDEPDANKAGKKEPNPVNWRGKKSQPPENGKKKKK